MTSRELTDRARSIRASVLKAHERAEERAGVYDPDYERLRLEVLGHLIDLREILDEYIEGGTR